MFEGQRYCRKTHYSCSHSQRFKQNELGTIMPQGYESTGMTAPHIDVGLKAEVMIITSSFLGGVFCAERVGYFKYIC